MSSSGLAAPVGTLPRPLTTFVGRDSHVDELLDLIQQPHVRLVTVTGPGGVGKTRLAIEVGARTVDSFPDSVFFVPLAPISDPGLIVSVIAQSVGAQILPSRTELAELKAHIRERQMLLVIDNFEHVVDAAAVIAELLADCPSLKVLATSRVRLRISGEHQYPLAPLSVAVQGQEGAELPGSVRLFVERARAAEPSFAITDENAELVFSVCKRLEGLPLAIELAAARITMLSLSGMLARLDRTLPLLSGGARDLPERQRTMRDTIAWSYDLLSDAEQRVFRRLGPLGSGFSFEVIEPVVVLEGEEAGDLLEIVASLVDKSLMYRDIGLAGDTRYVMLETVREYALEQLEAAGETEALTELQSARIRDFVIDVQPNLTGQRGLQGFWLRRIDDEFVNIRSAMDHFERAGDVTSLLHLVFSLDWYFTTRAARVNTVRWQELAKADDLGVENWLRIEVLQIMAFLTGIHGNARDSLACAEAALALARLGDDASALGLAYLSMGFAAEFAGQPERALEMGFEAVPRFREAADLRWLPYGLSNLGDLLIYFGRWEEARPLVEEAISLATASGDDFGLAVFTGDLARVRRHEGDLASALRLFRESHALFDQVDGMRGKLGCIAGLASIAFDQGQPEHAARLLGAIDAQMQRAGVKVMAFNLMTRRIKDEVRERLGEEAYEREFEAGRSIPWSDAVADAMALAVDTTGDSEDESPVNPFGLTSRERDVLRQLIEGRSDKEIADALYIGARTVQTHVANLLAKLDVHNRAEAAAVAVRKNLL